MYQTVGPNALAAGNPVIYPPYVWPSASQTGWCVITNATSVLVRVDTTNGSKFVYPGTADLFTPELAQITVSVAVSSDPSLQSQLLPTPTYVGTVSATYYSIDEAQPSGYPQPIPGNGPTGNMLAPPEAGIAGVPPLAPDITIGEYLAPPPGTQYLLITDAYNIGGAVNPVYVKGLQTGHQYGTFSPDPTPQSYSVDITNYAANGITDSVFILYENFGSGPVFPPANRWGSVWAVPAPALLVSVDQIQANTAPVYVTNTPPTNKTGVLGAQGVDPANGAVLVGAPGADKQLLVYKVALQVGSGASMALYGTLGGNGEWYLGFIGTGANQWDWNTIGGLLMDTDTQLTIAVSASSASNIVQVLYSVVTQ